MKWYENLLLLPFAVVVLLFSFIVEALFLIGLIKDEFLSNKKG